MSNPQWCERHWSEIRDAGGNGIAAAMLLMQALIDNDRFPRRVKRRQAMGDDPTSAQNKALAEVSPVCCFLGDEVMEKIKAEAIAVNRPGEREGKTE